MPNGTHEGERCAIRNGGSADQLTRTRALEDKAAMMRTTIEAKVSQMIAVKALRVAGSWLLLSLALANSACATVPQYRRGHLADPTMPGNESKLEVRSDRKFHATREAAAGGDGETAGGGCGCAN
jgi:hypothetical protein